MFHPPKNEEVEDAMAIAHTLGVRDPCLLHVGTIESRKNLVRVLEARSSLSHADRGDIPGWRVAVLEVGVLRNWTGPLPRS